MNDRYIVEREFEHAGCKCVVTFGNMGHRCGYVGIPSTHPLHGEDLQYAYEKFPQYRKEISLSMECERKFPIEGEVVRSEEYVADECKRLAEQLKEFETEVH